MPVVGHARNGKKIAENHGPQNDGEQHTGGLGRTDQTFLERIPGEFSTDEGEDKGAEGADPGSLGRGEPAHVNTADND